MLEMQLSVFEQVSRTYAFRTNTNSVNKTLSRNCHYSIIFLLILVKHQIWSYIIMLLMSGVPSRPYFIASFLARFYFQVAEDVYVAHIVLCCSFGILRFLCIKTTILFSESVIRLI